MPTVSVIIPAHNQGHYLGEAISSALSQTFKDIEVIVVDDGSTDNTRQVATSFSDSRLRYIHQENRGLSGARNTGIREAKGDFLTYLDSDDLFLPNKLHLLMNALGSNLEVGLAAGQAILIDEEGQPLGEIFERGLPQEGRQILLGNPLHVGSVLIRRQWQEKTGFFDESLRSYEDWDMWLRMARAGCKTVWVPKPVSLYRFHKAQMTQNGQQMTTASFAVLEKTFQDPSLPMSWSRMRDVAFSRGYLRAAAQSYTASSFDEARRYMREALCRDRELCENNAERLAGLVAGWANYVKTREPLSFLRAVYDHLPSELSALRRRRNGDLARQAMQLAHMAQKKNDWGAANSAAWSAIRWRPCLLGNKSVVWLLATSEFNLLKGRFSQGMQLLFPGRFAARSKIN